MFKYFIVSLILLSGNAFAAIDLTQCEKIGYEKGTNEYEDCADIEITCNSADKCDYLDDMIKNNCNFVTGKCFNGQDCMYPDIKNEQCCHAFIDKMNKDEETEKYLLKCVANDEMLIHKTDKFYMGAHDGFFVLNDGSEMNLADALKDNKHIYLRHHIAYGDKDANVDKYTILDSYDKKDNIYMFNEFE